MTLSLAFRIGAATGIVVWALVAPSCAHVQRHEVEVRPCLPRPAPEIPVVVFAGAGVGCPEKFAACLSSGSAVALDLYLREMRLWAEEVEETCGE